MQATRIALVLAHCALLALCVQARSPYSSSDFSSAGLNLNPYQDSFNEDANSQLAREENSPLGHQFQQPAGQYAKDSASDDSDDADESDDGSDSTENMPVRNYAGSAAADAGEDSDASELTPLGGQQQLQQGSFAAAQQQQLSGSSGLPEQQWANSDIDADAELDGDENDAAASSLAKAQDELGLDTNIANAKIEMSPRDMSPAAGHHYHGHGVHGMLKMGAESGKKGAFKWYDKHPVGGKGRR